MVNFYLYKLGGKMKYLSSKLNEDNLFTENTTIDIRLNYIEYKRLRDVIDKNIESGTSVYTMKELIRLHDDFVKIYWDFDKEIQKLEKRKS